MRKFRHARRLRGELMSEINITPFVDVLLVLLVSFLISAPLMTLALPIQLPKGKLKERAPDYENSILAVVNKKNIMKKAIVVILLSLPKHIGPESFRTV